MSDSNLTNEIPKRFAVIIAWWNGTDFCALARDGGDGPIRVYPLDEYDARLDLGRDEPIMFCGVEDQARVFMMSQPGRDGAVQLPTRLAPAFGFARKDLDLEALALLPEQGEPEPSPCKDEKA